MDILKNSKLFESYLASEIVVKEPVALYMPIRYILDIGGKRVRPLLVLMAIEVLEGDVFKGLPAALAVEVFHNFTLLHDDIMDDAPLRRNAQTVHEKWNVNTAILSGDAMMIMANQYLEKYDSEYKALMQLFQKTALEVCEGQQMDMDFENCAEVSMDAYVEMIKLKTSVLVACALKMGAIIGGAASEDADLMYEYGLNLGLAFQLQDDYLDAFGDPKTFGKQVGGDIIENKKTYLYIKALENLHGEEQVLLKNLFTIQSEEVNMKIHLAKELFIKSNAVTSILTEIQLYTAKANQCVKAMNISQQSKDQLFAFSDYLLNRKV